MHRLVGRTYDEVVGKDGHLTQYYMFDLAKGADGTIGIYAYYVYIYTLVFSQTYPYPIYIIHTYMWRLLPWWPHTPCTMCLCACVGGAAVKVDYNGESVAFPPYVLLGM